MDPAARRCPADSGSDAATCEVGKPTSVFTKGRMLTAVVFAALLGLGIVAGIAAIEIGRG